MAKVLNELDWLINGKLDSKNTREIGGYLVSLTSLESANGVVGLSSLITGGDDLRIWAGNANRELAAFRVYESGYIVATRFLLQSENSSARIELSSSGSLLRAGNDTDQIVISADYDGNPALLFVENERGAIALTSLGDFYLLTTPGVNINIWPDNNLNLLPNGNIRIKNWGKLYNIDNGETLQQALDNKADEPPAIFTDTIDLSTANEIVVWRGFIVDVH
jgi:hypothetical protein